MQRVIIHYLIESKRVKKMDSFEMIAAELRDTTSKVEQIETDVTAWIGSIIDKLSN